MTLLVGRQEGHPADKKTEWWGAGVVICLEQGADLHMAQLMPLPLTVSCFCKIQIGFTFVVPAHPGSPGQRAVKRVCVCVCVCVCTATNDICGSGNGSVIANLESRCSVDRLPPPLQADTEPRRPPLITSLPVSPVTSRPVYFVTSHPSDVEETG